MDRSLKCCTVTNRESANVGTAEEATAERRVCYGGYTKFAARLEQRDLGVLNIEREGTVLHLHSGDGMHGVRAAEGGGGDLREAYVLDFALPRKG
jgi:hypothetical protein